MDFLKNYMKEQLMKFSLIALLTLVSVGCGNDERVSLEFPRDITVGNYELGTSTDYKGLYHPNFESSGYRLESGTMTINSLNVTAKIIEGTFNFMAKRRDPNEPDVTYEITEGNFSAEIH